MATSNVEIANRALQILGSSHRLESLTQDHPNARTITAAFQRTREALLRRYKWNFAVKRASVAADSVNTLWGGWKRYPLPADCARLLRDNETGTRSDWTIEGRFITTADSSPLEFLYIALITDPQQFDPLFDEVFAYKLAVACCREVTGEKPSPDLLEEARQVLADAKQSNAYEEDAVEALEDDWLLARL